MLAPLGAHGDMYNNAFDFLCLQVSRFHCKTFFSSTTIFQTIQNSPSVNFAVHYELPFKAILKI